MHDTKIGATELEEIIKTHQEVLKSTDKYRKVRTINIMGSESSFDQLVCLTLLTASIICGSVGCWLSGLK